METVILRQLVADYKQIAYQFRLELKMPVLLFTDLENVWGRWNPHSRTIEIRRRLVYEHSWDTVLYVLKHEMAHQIVSEVFGLPDSDHAESFQRACDLLAIPPEFRKGSGDLAEPNAWKEHGQKTDAIVSVIERVQKLMALARSTNEAEAAVAITRAHELIRKYNIQENLYSENKEKFRYLLFDTGKQRLNPVYSHLASMLIHFYNVDVIFTSTFSAKTLKNSQCLELYGRETHAVIAEYILHFMLRTLESLWLEHKKRTGAPNGLKKSYQLGVLAGFQQKLETEERAHEAPAVAPKRSHEKALIARENEERKSYIEKRYPRLRSRSSGRSAIDSGTYERGVRQGRDVQIHRAIHKGATGLKFLKGLV